VLFQLLAPGRKNVGELMIEFLIGIGVAR